MLPADINVLRIEPVPHRFHARHDAVSRSYVYQVARRRTAFAKPFVWWVKDELDVRPMREAASIFVGMHDFRSFTDSDPDDVSTKVQLGSVEVKEDGDADPDARERLALHLEDGAPPGGRAGRSRAGRPGRGGRRGRSWRNARRMPARLTAPPSGLFLERVVYPGEPGPGPLKAVTPLAR